MSFIDLRLIAPIYRAITKEGYTEPTPIQAQAIPNLLQGKDVIGIAQTGTGKTAAFVLPLLQKLECNHKKRIKFRPRALILAPTRELAAQIGKSCATYGRFTGVKYTEVFGGVSQGGQVTALRNGVDILVATPGRLLDLMDQKYIHLDNVETFILDEADRMLDMGFVKDIRKLLPYLPKKRQTVMFSATMSPEITKLAHDFLKNPVRVRMAEAGSAVKRIAQELYFVEKAEKLALLLHLISNGMDHVLIFTRTKAGADKVARMLKKQKIPAESIHGDKRQNQRTRILERFKRGKSVLVATDVAARGIDVEGISHVINFDLPNEPENYVHRIGRTARAGSDGTAFSFCDETEKDYLKAIERQTGKKLRHVDHPFHSELAKNSTQKPPKRGGGQRKTGKKPVRGRPSKKSFGRSRAGRGAKQSAFRKRKPAKGKRSFRSRSARQSRR